MAIVEFQFRKQAFLNYFKAEINRMRLPFPTLDLFAFPKLKGHLLEQIECVNCTADATEGDGQITVRADLVIHYHTSLVTIRAAGSLNRAITEQQPLTLPVVVSVKLIPQPDGTNLVQLQWSAAFGIFPPGIFPMALPQGLIVKSGAIEASDNIIALRLGTQPDDPVSAPITNRLGNSEWSQLISGQVIAEQLASNLAKTLDSALSADLTLSKSAYGNWFPSGIPGISWKAPFALAQAEVTAVDKCIFDIDISVDLSLVAELEVSGPSLTTTLTLNWDADSTLCDLVGTLLLTPIGGIAIHVIAEDKASDTILGISATPDRFQKIGDTDDSITYQSKTALTGPSEVFALTHSEINADGLLVTGDIHIRPLPLGLQGSISVPASGLHTDCSKKRVTVEFRHAQLFLNDIGMDGPPRLFTPGILFNPDGAWVSAYGTSNDWLDLALIFLDPPAGRLPAGTATSVIVVTDCGVRWVDLGVIPTEHKPPTVNDIAQMISQCMAIHDPWGMGVMHLDWLVDPPDMRTKIDPLRQWTVAARELPNGISLRFLAVDDRGQERVIGETNGRQNIAAYITTNANETLRILTGQPISAPAPVVFQRWIMPFASIPLHGSPTSVSAMGNLVGVREHGGETLLVQIGAGGVADASRLNKHQRQTDPRLESLLINLSREEKRDRKAWAAAAHPDRDTVAVIHGHDLVVGKLGPIIKM